MNSNEKEVWDQELRLRSAMERGDVSELNQLISDELLFVIPSGQVMGKKDDLESHRTGSFQIKSAFYTEESVRSVGDIVVTSAKTDMTGSWMGHPFQGIFRYMRVWQFESGWRVVSGSGTPIL